MRNPTDNSVAVASQMLIFLWIFALLLRLAGMFQRSTAAILMGVTLCAVTAAVFVMALTLANNDRLRNKKLGDSTKDAATDDDNEPARAPANDLAEAPLRPSWTTVEGVGVETVDVVTAPHGEEEEKKDTSWLGLGGVVCSL